MGNKKRGQQNVARGIESWSYSIGCLSGYRQRRGGLRSSGFCHWLFLHQLVAAGVDTQCDNHGNNASQLLKCNGFTQQEVRHDHCEQW